MDGKEINIPNKIFSKNKDKNKNKERCMYLLILKDKINDIFYQESNMNKKEVIDLQEKIFNLLNKEISNSCPSHNFIEDMIDIDVERSQKITYCSNCFTTL